MGTFLLVLLIVGFLLVAMSIGVIMGRKPISGTCGGIGALGLGGSCDICGGDTKKCEEENERKAAKDGTPLAYNAMDEKRS
ncbi:MAG: (Na+)-NQR maturation NqrM [Marinobacter sp.]|uniref:(Na+)-NQR maturation NqrM n=1 Tax=Marinobacter sp. TaxID=50741 RepID=UPI00299DDD6B|nr:(Na+)-NQR maturation NqrM [Marinobacter sp.]MDX1633376.1 (Na+)-NQR maturation NqrM [Marinobacter sp.]